MFKRFALALLLGLLAGAMPCAAQQHQDHGKPGKDAAKKSAAKAGKPAAGAQMDVKPAPKSGTMPGRQTPAPKGRLGTEPAQKGKLGTPPTGNSKDRPPRPQ